MSGSSSGKQSSSAWPLLLLVVAAAAVLYTMQNRRPPRHDFAAGQPLPPLDLAGGWLNTDRPLTLDDLHGRVVLVEYWFTGCHFCTQKRPDLIELYDKYRDQGLTVVGFTPEPTEERDHVARYVDQTHGMDWPIAYGAGMVTQMMEVRGYPTYTLYDRSGQSVFSSHALNRMEDAVVAALAKD